MSILSVIGSLVLILLVLVFTWYATRWYARHMNQGFASRNIQVLERSQLGVSAFVAVVRVGERFYLLGVGDKNVSLLCELEDYEAPQEPGSAAVPFSQVLGRMLDKARSAAKGKDGDNRP